jgi:hypothetical protein
MKHRYDEAKETELEKGDPIQLLHCREAISGRIHSRLERESYHWRVVRTGS